jgi:dipeptidyl aminopeptidase/acylaminoacyl peptidase
LLRKLSTGMPEGGSNWVLDHRNEPRVLSVIRDGRRKIFGRLADSTQWSQLADFDSLGKGFSPWLMDSDGQLLVLTSQGRGGEALYAYDIEKRHLNPEPVLAVNGFDLDPESEMDSRTGRLVGLHFRTDRPTSYWFDDKLDTIQRSLDKALPGRYNRLYCGRCESSRFLVVRSSSDRHPGEYLLFDRTTAKLATLGAARPWIDEKSQGRRSFHRVAARDGLSMPVYVTHPPGAKDTDPLPAVVLVHGGPWVRGSDLRWNADAQFLASRGYRVIEPEFRGSSGYGWAHFEAGWKQWGRTMQDDLADAVQWAAKQRLVDPSRVCIMGGSYGGYAALMGPIRHPDTYRCAISFAGVTDIELMFSIRWSDIGDQAKQYGMPRLIGDPVKDAERLRTVSPLQRVAEIKVPVLLAHGSLDRRVPTDHARKFGSAARDAGVAIEQVYYNDEGHGWFMPANHADFLGRVERFLAKSLGSR